MAIVLKKTLKGTTARGGGKARSKVQKARTRSSSKDELLIPTDRKAPASIPVESIEQIRKKHDGKWVLIGDPKTNRAGEVLAGQVLYAGRDKKELYEAARRFNVFHIAIEDYNEWPKVDFLL